MPIIYLNGKFAAQRMTGVQRYAHNLVQALDLLLPGAGPTQWVLLCPPGTPPPALAHIEVRQVGLLGLPLHAWEQICLPWAARRGLLLNLAGSAPLLATRQWCTLHDAAVFDHPEAYTPLFVAWYRTHFRWLARHAERLLTVSAYSQGRLAHCLRLAPGAVAIVPNGGDHFARLQADEQILGTLALMQTRFVLAVGSNSPTKNLPALLKAWRQWPHDDNLRLVLVGGADPRVFAGDGGTDEVASADTPDVLRTGVLSDAQLKALYAHALCLVFPSLDEGFGLPPLEAMALGCPVAAANAGAIPEVCGDAVLYFDPRSVGSITTVLQCLIDDAGLRQRNAAAGRRRAASQTWQSSAQQLLGLLSQAGRA